jgi:hypothetical protein
MAEALQAAGLAKRLVPKKFYLGVCTSEEEAARVVDRMRIKLSDDTHLLNVSCLLANVIFAILMLAHAPGTSQQGLRMCCKSSCTLAKCMCYIHTCVVPVFID